MTWLDEDARAGSILTASIEDRFAADIMDFKRTHQMWSFLRQKYESTDQSTYLAATRQEQLLRHGDSTVEDFFDQLSIVWRQLDTLGPQLSPVTCPSCRDQTAALELRRTYDFLTRLRDEFAPLRAQLLARRPYVSLMYALTEVRNEEVRLCDVGLLQSATVLTARSSASRSSSARPTASVSLASPPVVTMAMWRRSATGRRKLRKLSLAVIHMVLVVLVLEDLRGVLLVQRHRRFSRYFIALRLLCQQELLVLWLSPLHL
jgi:hypothetical protein